MGATGEAKIGPMGYPLQRFRKTGRIKHNTGYPWEVPSNWLQYGNQHLKVWHIVRNVFDVSPHHLRGGLLMDVSNVL